MREKLRDQYDATHPKATSARPPDRRSHCANDNGPADLRGRCRFTARSLRRSGGASFDQTIADPLRAKLQHRSHQRVDVAGRRCGD